MESRHVDEFCRRKDVLVAQAREVADNAYSYRNFRVGCAVLAYSEQKGGYDVFVGVNFKPLSDGPKICAEEVAIGSAVANGYKLIVAIAVVGPPQLDDHSGREMSRLEPCWICRTLFGAMPFVSDESFLVTARNHEGEAHETTFGAIVCAHEEAARANGKG